MDRCFDEIVFVHKHQEEEKKQTNKLKSPMHNLRYLISDIAGEKTKQQSAMENKEQESEDDDKQNYISLRLSMDGFSYFWLQVASNL
ncbi:CLUMA_CG010184, isoform A [Clunio marinus]|uniref:CLUMA_CG010184, isoform A n=1 Tax=Clunio marinus TaxID=568069 RepID=A0A1J1I9U6_9DIPT|nr:CLUMA_CG010184, isoform A [Clunio marinus]